MATTDTGTNGPDDASKSPASGVPNISPDSAKNIPSPFPQTPVPGASSPLPTGTPGEGPPGKTLQTDIAHILEGVKLPERRGAATTRDTSKPSIYPASPAPEMAAPPPQTQQQPLEKSSVTPLHTLKDDLQSVVRDQKISVVHAAALEEDKRATQASIIAHTNVHSAQKRRVVSTFAVITGLIVLGLLALGAVFMIMNERAGTTATEVFSTDSLLFSEQTIPFPIQNRSAAELKRLLADARVSASLTLGAITRIAPIVEDTNLETGEVTERLATTEEFLDALRAQAPEELVRALGSEFFFGFHTVDENAPVLIIPVTSYERAFAGMLLWEDMINTELSPVFTAVPSLIQENGLLKKRTFKDLVMRNYDVRALTDDKGEVQLYYSFPTRELLVIAESSFSFTEILSRLRADRRL
ncbi:MAG: hypothetical protein G01um10148_85 [Parcubacteria group bacterium Gr01-1014_8]|nr:MAG: hypothetical protein G01um10148_85 [Parcubacteria group bacterium Gr01-1014_8]